MSQIIIAIATVIIGVVLATYGVYTSFEASKRTQYTSLVNGVFSRSVIHVDSLAQSLGRYPSDTEVEDRFFGINDRDDVIFRYSRSTNLTTDSAYLCARSRSTPTKAMNDAFDRVVEHWPNALRGADCNTSGGPSATLSSVTLLYERPI